MRHNINIKDIFLFLGDVNDVELGGCAVHLYKDSGANVSDYAAKLLGGFKARTLESIQPNYGEYWQKPIEAIGTYGSDDSIMQIIFVRTK